MSHEDGLGNNGPESTGLNQPDDGDNRMQKKNENVAHGRDVIRLNKLKNSRRLENSSTTARDCVVLYHRNVTAQLRQCHDCANSRT